MLSNPLDFISAFKSLFSFSDPESVEIFLLITFRIVVVFSNIFSFVTTKSELSELSSSASDIS